LPSLSVLLSSGHSSEVLPFSPRVITQPSARELRKVVRAERRPNFKVEEIMAKRPGKAWVRAGNGVGPETAPEEA
jgi:hypothetical protein